ncbi:hypothetical protein EV384_6344 [Micromonospora kangleipakensis]|uniref:Uncharacterized protein n=1 Tax=Micromonospora kangleipakensis TaxID=1077942 RepID=A0A4Q8BJK4_9ACTN|nr:hypothetical protein [Micromonospora kangleipakensis]RZU77613.1 hypothetical protein EV384_6344 [Micromonospora kangleipakensis]
MNQVTKDAWQIIQGAPAFGRGLVRRVRSLFLPGGQSDLDVMYEGETWIVVVEYLAVPVEPYAEPDGPMPDERRGRLMMATVDGTSKTRMTAEVVADNKPVAERIALSVVRWWAHIYRLPEPSRIHVMDNEAPELG